MNGEANRRSSRSLGGWSGVSTVKRNIVQSKNFIRACVLLASAHVNTYVANFTDAKRQSICDT